jgi:hypothetical protein
MHIIAFLAIAAAPATLLERHGFVFPAKNPNGGKR